MFTHLWCSYQDGKDDIAAVRTAVFAVEQGFTQAQIFVPAEDDKALQLVIYDGETPVGCGRLLPLTQKNAYKAGRIAVLKAYRGQRLGRRIVALLCEKAEALRAETVYISAQTHAVAFYENCGFRQCAPPHIENGAPHVMMVQHFEK
ncbi:MAG: GNAT family N-acetyltransferase [Clostridia bacterium]|nr:GNAT family N-acetyltransferase [Clostridia bacterium]